MQREYLLIIALLLIISFASAHGTAEHETHAESIFHQFPAIDFLIYASIIILLVVFASLHFNKFWSENAKKAAFATIAIATLLSTFYLAAATVYENVASESGGPVHWHADYEIWACGQKLELEQSEGLENKIGSNVFHHHNDYRIHVEGVVNKTSDVSLGKFFETIGGKFTKDSLTVRLKDKTIETWENGDNCPDGKTGTLKMFVNGKQNGDLDDYVIAPYGTVPPGDFIKIVFE